MRSLSLVCLLATCLLTFSSTVRAQVPAPDPVVPESTATGFTIGKITVDKQAKTVRFPATVNLVAGPLEYLVVTETGKTHESLFATTVSPYQLHVAMLLLGVHPSREISGLPPEQLNANALKTAPELDGDKVDVLVTWKSGPDEKKVHAEEWITNGNTKAAMTTGAWIYTGSAIFEKRFLAQEEGSVIALVTDQSALINNPRAGHNDDSIWSARKNKIPALGTPVEITFQLLSTPPSNPALK